MPLSRANPPLAGGRERVKTRRSWPHARMMLANVGESVSCWWLNLSGGDGKVVVTDNAQIQDLFSGDCTLEFMFRYDNQIDSYGKLLHKYTSVGFRLEIMGTQDLRVFAIFDGTNLNFTTNNVTFVHGTDYHIEVVFDGTAKTVQIFVNGVEATYSVSTAGTSSYTSDAGVALVMGGTTGSANNLTGAIYWVHFSDIKRHVGNFSAPGRCDVPTADGNTVELWAFDDNGATIAASVASPADDGAVSGTYSWGYE